MNKVVELLKKNFPELVRGQEGTYEVDMEKLKLELGKGSDIINEGYSLNWLGQSYSRVLRDCPTTTLIKPDNKHNQLKENINSNNVYIEGDNLEVLKHLKNAYSSKIKMIYIDPPYNTGSDGFVYNDSFNFDVETFMRLSGLDKEEAEKVLNYTKSKRNSHSAWLTFMYPRLYIARELLKDDGVIFISIDDNEQAQLKLLCDQIFGEENFIEMFKYIKTKTPPSASNKTRNMIEYILCYSKTKTDNKFIAGTKSGGDAPLYNETNSLRTLVFPADYVYTKLPDGVYNKGKRDKIELLNDVHVKDGIITNEFSLKGNFRWLQATLDEEIAQGTKLVVKSDKFSIRYSLQDERAFLPADLISDVGTNETGRKEIETQFGRRGIFSFPKPTSLLKFLIYMIDDSNSLVLDFFSGSSTTADAVMQLNAEDNGNRKFIMVQLPEEIDEKNSKEAYEFCTKELKQEPIIPTIAKERIKRAANKIKEENKDKEYLEDLDLGFKVYKTIKDDRTDVSQLVLFDVKDGIKTDVDDLEALLTTWMLHDGYDLNTKVEEIMINKYKGFLVEQTLYLLDKGFSTEDLLSLVEKLNDPNTPLINQIILNSSNFGNKVLQEFHENVFSKNSKEAKIVVEDR